MFAISNDDDEKTKNYQGIISHSFFSSFSLDINNHLTGFYDMIDLLIIDKYI